MEGAGIEPSVPGYLTKFQELDPKTTGIDTRVSAGAGGEAEWREEEVRAWKSLGVTHLTLANYYESGHLHRSAGRSLGDHIAAMRRYWNAVADLL